MTKGGMADFMNIIKMFNTTCQQFYCISSESSVTQKILSSKKYKYNCPMNTAAGPLEKQIEFFFMYLRFYIYDSLQPNK